MKRLLIFISLIPGALMGMNQLTSSLEKVTLISCKVEGLKEQVKLVNQANVCALNAFERFGKPEKGSILYLNYYGYQKEIAFVKKTLRLAQRELKRAKREFEKEYGNELRRCRF